MTTIRERCISCSYLLSRRFKPPFSYIPNKNLIQNHLQEISKKLDLCSSKYDNFILLGDFNAEPNEACMEDFCINYSLFNLIKERTCFKNTENPSSLT